MSTIASNKKAYHDLFIESELEAGIKLLGHEVKTLKTQGADLKASYVRVLGNEAFVLNINIPLYKKAGDIKDHNTTRTRKLLLKKSEINAIIGALSRKGFFVVPLKIYTKGDIIKIKIGVGKKKKKYDKREVLKKRQIKREIEREAKVVRRTARG